LGVRRKNSLRNSFPNGGETLEPHIAPRKPGKRADHQATWRNIIDGEKSAQSAWVGPRLFRRVRSLLVASVHQ
jgi:hypothetical protein